MRDVVHRMTKSHRYSLIEVGLVINNLMGNGFRCQQYLKFGLLVSTQYRIAVPPRFHRDRKPFVLFTHYSLCRSSYTRRKFRLRYEMAAAAGNHCSTSTPIGGGGGQAANNSSLPASCSMKRKKVHVLKKNNTENSIKVDNSTQVGRGRERW